MVRFSINNGEFVNIYDIYDEYDEILEKSDDFTVVIVSDGLNDIIVDINSEEKRIIFKDLIDLEDSEAIYVLNYYEGFLNNFEEIEIIPILDNTIGVFDNPEDAAYEYITMFYSDIPDKCKVLFKDIVLRAISDEFLISYNDIYYECY